MRYIDAFPRYLLKMSYAMGICVSVCSIMLTLYLFINAPWVSFNAVVFVIPVSLCAWMFRKTGLVLCLFFLFVFLWLFYVLNQRSFLLAFHTLIFLIISVTSLLVAGFFVSSQRNAFDLAEQAQQQLSIAYEKQQKLNKIQDQFLQHVNHELRTPLTAIYGYLELLFEHNDRLDSKMRSTFIEHAMQSCDELQLLVNNVLDTMGVESEKNHVQVEELLVIDIIHEVLERFDPKTLQSHSIQVNVPDYISVRANVQYTRQVLRNLLANAFKYVPAGTTITISAALFGNRVQPFHPSPEICICVTDEGPGIPKDEQSLLFGQFVRLMRDTSGRIRGSGLGLYLSKQFVELMDGHIWVESEGIPGKGCSFCFTLPCIPVPTVKPQIRNNPYYITTIPIDL